MEKLRRVIKTKADCKNFVDNLLLSLRSGDMDAVDGFFIGLIYTNSGYIYLAIRDQELPPLTDNVIQQLSQALVWMQQNETRLLQYTIKANHG